MGVILIAAAPRDEIRTIDPQEESHRPSGNRLDTRTKAQLSGMSLLIAGNLRCHFLCARAALPLLHKSGKGSLVSVASTTAVDVVKNYTHYGMAKAGIVGMVKGLARENVPRVRVNAVVPGLTNTAFLISGTGREQIFDSIPEAVYAKRVPMKRMARPQDMAGPILFLLGAASATTR